MNRKEFDILDYKVIYSINYINMPIIVYIAFAMTIILSFLVIKKNSIIRTQKMVGGVIFIAFISGVFCIKSIHSHFGNVKALKCGDYKLVEGKVINFSSASSNLKNIESFEVGGKRFEYSNALLNGGLNHSIEGLVKNGSIVRVYYKNDDILKLDIKNEDS